jgi:hypothetical protein
MIDTRDLEKERYEKIQESHIFYADAMQKIIRRVENDN